MSAAQKDRILDALRRHPQRGITAVDFMRLPTIDGGAPITRVAARIDDLKRDGHNIVSGERRDKCVVYRLQDPSAVSPTSRSCPVCGRALVRRAGESPTAFATRKTCGRQCANELHRQPERPLYAEEDRGYTSNCWVWLRRTTQRGYGHVSVGGRTIMAHRWFYENARGPVPEGMFIDHLCRVTSCVNPDHLEIVTTAENNRRASRTRLTAAQAAEIKASPLSLSKLAEIYGVSRSAIAHVKSGRSWADVSACAPGETPEASTSAPGAPSNPSLDDSPAGALQLFDTADQEFNAMVRPASHYEEAA